MDTKELAELLLAYLYDKAEAEAHSFFFFPLGEFAALAGTMDAAELIHAARMLEDRGFVMLSQDVLGQTSAFLNLEGISFVESGGETGIIAKFRENPRAFLMEDEGPGWFGVPEPTIVQFSPDMMNQAPNGPGLEGPENKAEKSDLKPYILRIITAILDERAIDDVTRADLLRDAETLNIQLSKTTRNRTVIDSLMAELSSVPSLAYLTAELSMFI